MAGRDRRRNPAADPLQLHAGHTITFSYDALGRPTSQADNLFGTTAAEYDLAGRRTRLIRPPADERFEYLATGAMKTVLTEAGFVLATIGYDALGRRSSLAMYNGTVTSYSYDGAGRLASLAHDFAGTAHDVTFTYAYNPAGQIVGRTSSNDLYGFTGVSNQSGTDSHNGLNQVTTSGAVAVSHDARGNTTAIGSANFVYTVDNLLATGPGGNYAYDPLGRMMHSGPAARDFMYDIGSGRLLGEKAMNGGPVLLSYTPGPGVDETLMVWNPSTGAVDPLHTDERGSVIAVSDGSGNVTAINRYDDYGMPEGPSGTGTQAGRFGYTGQAWLPEQRGNRA